MTGTATASVPLAATSSSTTTPPTSRSAAPFTWSPSVSSKSWTRKEPSTGALPGLASVTPTLPPIARSADECVIAARSTAEICRFGPVGRGTASSRRASLLLSESSSTSLSGSTTTTSLLRPPAAVQGTRTVRLAPAARASTATRPSSTPPLPGSPEKSATSLAGAASVPPLRTVIAVSRLSPATTDAGMKATPS